MTILKAGNGSYIREVLYEDKGKTQNFIRSPIHQHPSAAAIGNYHPLIGLPYI